MSVSVRFILTLACGLAFAADPTTPPKPEPTVSELQKQLADRDAQIASLKSQLIQAAAHQQALSTMYQAAYNNFDACSVSLAIEKQPKP